MKILGRFIGQRPRLLQSEAVTMPLEDKGDWDRLLASLRRHDNINPEPRPEPPMDYWLIDNAARVADQPN